MRACACITLVQVHLDDECIEEIDNLEVETLSPYCTMLCTTAAPGTLTSEVSKSRHWEPSRTYIFSETVCGRFATWSPCSTCNWLDVFWFRDMDRHRICIDASVCIYVQSHRVRNTHRCT